MHARRAPANDFCRGQRRQVFQPKAGPLSFAVTELPRLNALGEVFEIHDAILGVLVHHRILNRDPLNRRIPEVGKQRRAFVQRRPHFINRLAGWWRGQPANTRVAEARARRVRDHQQVPPVVQQIARITDDMTVRAVFARQQVAGPSVVTSIQKRVADCPAVFARDEDPHTKASCNFDELTVLCPFCSSRRLRRTSLHGDDSEPQDTRIDCFFGPWPACAEFRRANADSALRPLMELSALLGGLLKDRCAAARRRPRRGRP